MPMKDCTLKVREVLENLATLAESYEKVSRGGSPNGNYFFAINVADMAASLKAAQVLIAQLPCWIPVSERLPPLMTEVLGWHPADRVRAWFRHSGQPKDAPYWELWDPQDRECDDCAVREPTHWMPLPEPPEVK